MKDDLESKGKEIVIHLPRIKNIIPTNKFMGLIKGFSEKISAIKTTTSVVAMNQQHIIMMRIIE